MSITDVARRAGVSHGTVSHVLNHPERVSPARREAVERAIAELGFVRHEAARHLRAGYSRTVGLILLDAWNPGFLDIARGVEDTLQEGRWSVIFANSSRDLGRQQSYLRLLTEMRVAGMIVIPHEEGTEGLGRIHAGGTPVVVVDRSVADSGPVVCVDDVSGGRLAAEHLLGLGHRHLAFVGDETLAGPVHQRLAGIQQAVDAAAGPVRLDIMPCALTAEGGRLSGEALARMPSAERPTAVLAAIDIVGLGLEQALLAHGIDIPGNISLMGYDDIALADQVVIPMTSVRRPHYEMGVTAARLLIDQLNGETGRSQVVFTPELIVRESTSSPMELSTPGSDPSGT